MEIVPEMNNHGSRKQYPYFIVRGDSCVAAPNGGTP